MDKLEMMVGYDINFYDKKFEASSNKLSNYMYTCFKSTIGDEIRGIAIEENLLKTWAYYFVTVADEDAKAGDKIMMNLIGHFKQLMNDTDNVKIQGEATTKLMVDTTFTRVWFGTSLHVMLINKYGKENYERAFKFIREEVLEKETKVTTLVLTD